MALRTYSLRSFEESEITIFPKISIHLEYLKYLSNPLVQYINRKVLTQGIQKTQLKLIEIRLKTDILSNIVFEVVVCTTGMRQYRQLLS